MSAKNIIGTLVLVVFVGGILFVVTNKPNPNVLNQSNETVPTEQVNTATSLETSNSEDKATDTTQSTTPTSYTLTQVSTHASATSCWTAIDGNVYDLTEWIGKHPGGERAILSICGKDGTAVFSGKHGMNGKQANILAGFKIGMLSN
jgi:cytochrome b involved in lipid metabolism